MKNTDESLSVDTLDLQFEGWLRTNKKRGMAVLIDESGGMHFTYNGLNAAEVSYISILMQDHALKTLEKKDVK